MSAWIEVHVKEGRRACIEANSVAAVIMAPGADGSAIATSEKPLIVAMRSGETLPGVVAISADNLILALGAARVAFRISGKPAIVLRADELERYLVKLAEAGELSDE